MDPGVRRDDVSCFLRARRDRTPLAGAVYPDSSGRAPG